MAIAGNDFGDDPADVEHVHGLGNRLAPPRFVLWAVVLGATLLLVEFGLHLRLAQAFIIGFDVATAVFLLSLVPLFRAHTPAEMCRHAAENDANRALLLGISIVVVLAILVAVGVELKQKSEPNVILVVTTLLFAWLFGNIAFGLHYGHVYYLEGRSEGGLNFPGEPDHPDYSDFMYFAFTIGMAFATSDVQVMSRPLRRLVAIHSFAAFVYNIGVVAFTVNGLAGGAGG